VFLSYNAAVMAIINKRAGHQMCEVREKLGLTMRDVYRLSKQIANSLRNRDYIVSPSRLCDIERKGATPNLYRLHALSLAYDCKVEQLLKFYGIADDHRGGRRNRA
jgi:transcriptional regulator with XRE-family HTH domain